MPREPWFDAPGGVADQIISRMRDHLERVAAVDWDYFADQRYRTDASLAVADFERLVDRYRPSASKAANSHSEPTT